MMPPMMRRYISLIVERLAFACLFAVATFSVSGLVGCNALPNDPATTIQKDGLTLRYDANRDRVVFVGPWHGPNLLEVRDFDKQPASDGSYTFFGGYYSWIAPQNRWRDESGNLKDWPPDPAMDVGPNEVVESMGDRLEAVGPMMRSGLVESKRFQVVDGSTIAVRHALRNVGTEAKERAIWTINAVPLGGVIAVRISSEDIFDEGPAIRVKNAADEPLRDKVSQEEGEWILVETGFDWATSGMTTDSFKVFYDRVAATQIAVWSNGYWFVRTGAPPDIFSSLQGVGESSVEVYANFGMQLFEAELLSPLQMIEPGAQFVFEETWKIIPSAQPDVENLGVFEE